MASVRFVFLFIFSNRDTRDNENKTIPDMMHLNW